MPFTLTLKETRMQKFRGTLVKSAVASETEIAEGENKEMDGDSISKDNLSYYMRPFIVTVDQQVAYFAALCALRIPYIWRMFIDLAALIPALAAYCSPIRHRQFLISTDLCEHQLMHYLSEYFPEKYEGTVILPVEDQATQVDLGERDGAQMAGDRDILPLTGDKMPEPGGRAIDFSQLSQIKRIQREFTFDKCTQEEYDLHRTFISGWRKQLHWTEEKRASNSAPFDGIPDDKNAEYKAGMYATLYSRSVPLTCACRA